jgi:hypothetical protein
MVYSLLYTNTFTEKIFRKESRRLPFLVLAVNEKVLPDDMKSVLTRLFRCIFFCYFFFFSLVSGVVEGVQ